MHNKHTLDDFRKPQRDRKADNDWTQDDILDAAKRIIKEMGIEGEISDPNEEKRKI